VHQRADGSVHVPEALRPWLGGVEALTPGMTLVAPAPGRSHEG
jgi:seryl-tRNA synthetase